MKAKDLPWPFFLLLTLIVFILILCVDIAIKVEKL